MIFSGCYTEPGIEEGVTYGAVDTDGVGDGDGDAPLPETDQGNGYVDCDPWAQDCPEGQKCVPAGTAFVSEITHNKCVPVLGEGEVGDACHWNGMLEATDDCGPDSYCWNPAWIEGEDEVEEAIGTCSAFCTGTPEQALCAAEGMTCVVANDGIINICVEGCNPITQDCSTDVHDQIGCYWLGDKFACVHSTLDIPLGEPCLYINDCAPGGVCMPAESLPSCAGESCCTPMCGVEDGEACSEQPGTVCVSVYEPGEEPFGLPNFGICTLPV